MKQYLDNEGVKALWKKVVKNFVQLGSDKVLRVKQIVGSALDGSADSRLCLGALSAQNCDYDDHSPTEGSVVTIDGRGVDGNISVCAANSVGIKGKGVNVKATDSDLVLRGGNGVVVSDDVAVTDDTASAASAGSVQNKVRGLHLNNTAECLYTPTAKLALSVTGNRSGYIIDKKGFAIARETPENSNSTDENVCDSVGRCAFATKEGQTYVGYPGDNGERNGMVAQQNALRFRQNDVSCMKVAHDGVTVFTSFAVGDSETDYALKCTSGGDGTYNTFINMASDGSSMRLVFNGVEYRFNKAKAIELGLIEKI